MARRVLGVVVLAQAQSYTGAGLLISQWFTFPEPQSAGVFFFRVLLSLTERSGRAKEVACRCERGPRVGLEFSKYKISRQEGASVTSGQKHTLMVYAGIVRGDS